MVQDLLHAGPGRGVGLEQPLDEAPGRDADSRRDRVLVLLDAGVRVLEGGRLKRGLPHDQRVPINNNNNFSAHLFMERHVMTMKV